ncbi:hypothetical protein BEN47_08735 [Hymenobacter lapidarius]|uniref:DUF6438 domain-containing protein n=1 Tax=Hymenobacter lapidarius TaxID=1908237 RepID=A0A1G1TC22_9BACT|nr:DUF6438 domain-containing protein [Hymenobacter lapidarius]OGX88422.1 hypothetical protein BEN47_08735 [Hymenobacter lapidarius]
MRFFTTLLLLITFGLTLPTCAQKKMSATQQTKVKKPSKKVRAAEARAKELEARQVSGPVLTFERTACFGKCPTYVMQVYADGRVVYEGRRYVPLMGLQELKLPAATVAEMLRNAKEANFEQFQERYAMNTSDLPSTVVGVRQANGQLKIVTVEEGAPTNVNMFFTYLSTRFDQLAQLGGVDR